MPASAAADLRRRFPCSALVPGAAHGEDAGMVGIVIVSHSARIADGVVELARQMAGPGGAIVAAGGLDAPDDPTGTDPTRILAALEVAGDGDGVVVLMDLGSAVQSAEQARAMLDPATAERVVLCEAPLVEGAVAAAVAASIGGSLRDVVAEARNALASKAAQLDVGSSGGGAVATTADAAGWSEATIVVTNPMGLHARPAARFVQTAAVFDAEILADNLSTGAGPARARSLTDIATLGASQGHQVRVRARGTQAQQALAALTELATRGFDEVHGPASAPASVTRPFVHDVSSSNAGAIRGLAASPGVAVGQARRLRRGPPKPR
jgi:multiphosphoryl transfer protein